MTNFILKKPSNHARTRNLILANLMVLALGGLAVPAAMAQDDRMAGSVPHSVPKKVEEPAPAKAVKVGKKAITDSDNAKTEDMAATSEKNTYKKFSGPDDRMAGPNPVDEPVTPESVTANNAQDSDPSAHISPAETEAARAKMAASTVPVEPELPPEKDVPLNKLEYYGLLNGAADHSLGIDLWIGSSRDKIAAMLPQIPAKSRYRTLDDLTARMLLTNTDAQYMGGSKSREPGADFMTLRIEKLNELGAYEEGAKLYALNPGKPYHERLARAGVTAMLSGARKPLGCLEVKAFAANYSDQPFWQQATAICNLFLANDVENQPQPAVDKAVFEGSPVLQKIVDNPNYKARPETLADLEHLSPIERIGVFTLHRVDYSRLARLNYSDLAKAEPGVVSSMLADSALPDRLRFYATLAGIANGAADSKDLAKFYESVNLGSVEGEGKSWKQLVDLYRQAKDKSPGSERDAILGHALALRSTFGTLSLLPFAPFLEEADPGNLTPESITSALGVMVKARTEMPQKWQGLGLAVISPQPVDDYKALTYLAMDIDQDFKPLNSLEDTEFKDVFDSLTPQQTKIVKTIYEKLDKSNKLHNIVAEETYEKDSVLTEADDYVMPLGDLLESLKLAQKDKRLGEVILISSILLRSTPAGTMSPEVLGEVLDGYKTVGLTREARDLAAEVVLGLRK